MLVVRSSAPTSPATSIPASRIERLMTASRSGPDFDFGIFRHRAVDQNRVLVAPLPARHSSGDVVRVLVVKLHCLDIGRELQGHLRAWRGRVNDPPDQPIVTPSVLALRKRFRRALAARVLHYDGEADRLPGRGHTERLATVRTHSQES